MRAFNSTQTLQHEFTNITTADVTDRNRADDLGKLRPRFLFYQQQKKQGHCTSNSGGVSQNVDPVSSRPHGGSPRSATEAFSLSALYSA